MKNKPDKFGSPGSSDSAIQLDLISKVRGISSAEEYFSELPDSLKEDKRVYGALLNAYVGAKVKDKAESFFDIVRNKGYALHPLPFNVMMTLYMKFKENDKVNALVSEMKEKNIGLDLYSYNIWLSAQSSIESMEEVYEEMKLDPLVEPSWTTFSTLTTMYMKLGGHLDKAQETLKLFETILSSTGRSRNRIPYHYLISLHGTVGNKEEVYRVWNIYKSIFTTIPNGGYHSIISSLVRVGDIEGAEKIYQELLLSVKKPDPNVGNLLIGWYVREGPFVKAKSFVDGMFEAGIKPNASTFELLAEGHMKEKRISETLSCFKEAADLTHGPRRWRPKLGNVSTFLELCEEQNGNNDSYKEEFLELLRHSGCLHGPAYMSLLGVGHDHMGIDHTDEHQTSNYTSPKTGDNYSEEESENEGSEMLLSMAE